MKLNPTDTCTEADVSSLANPHLALGFLDAFP